MARYIRTFQINTDLSTVYNTVNNFLLSEGYKPKTLDGYSVYKKGTGTVKEPNYFKFTVKGKFLIMETWTAFSVIPDLDIGEYDLNTPWYIFKEKAWSGRVATLENIFAVHLGCFIVENQVQ